MSPDIPVTPKQIADSVIAAAKAGAAVAHIHVRDPQTGEGSRDIDLFKETVDLVRASDTDVIINITAGMGGAWIPSEEDPSLPGPGSDMIGAAERLAHVEAVQPEICTLDCGTMNFGDNEIYVSTPDCLRAMARQVKEWGIKPELEVFDSGQLWFVNQMLSEGLLDEPALIQICLGIPWAAPADTSTLKAMVEHLPDSANWASFGLGAMQMPIVAQSVLLGGHVRVGLEDNLYLEKGVLATNAQLVDRARQIIELMGASVLTPAEARLELKLSSPQ